MEIQDSTEDTSKRNAFRERDRRRAQCQREKKKNELITLKCENDQLRYALTFATTGRAFIPPATNAIMDDFKRTVLNHCMSSSSEATITGYYSMLTVDPSKLLQFEVIRNLLNPYLGTAKHIFSSYLEKDVEVYIHSSAILNTPETLFAGGAQRPQVMHADNVGFVAITVLIMLSEDGGDSTHILDLSAYGPDVNHLRESLLKFSISQLDETSQQKKTNNTCSIQSAILARYGSLLQLTPDQFFARAHQKRMLYGEGEIFRSDNLHAGPSSTRPREGLFLEIRVLGDITPSDSDYQFRFTDLLRIAGLPSNKIDRLRLIWSTEGYFFPGDNPINNDEEQSPAQVDVVPIGRVRQRKRSSSSR